MVAFIIPAIGIIIGILWIFGLAAADTVAPRRTAPANTPIRDFYVPRWGAYRRRKAAEEIQDWETDFRRAVATSGR
jgi:hypothetical protein